MLELSNFNTKHFTFINYINLNEEQSKEIWVGRNHPEIRKWMTNSDPFSYKEHLKFIENLRKRTDRIFWAVLFQDKIVGSYCLNPYNSIEKKGEMGKFLFVEYWGRGLGKIATKEFLDYVLNNHIVNEIEIRTLIENKKNQHINEINGFKIYGQDDKYVFMKLRKEDCQ